MNQAGLFLTSINQACVPHKLSSRLEITGKKAQSTAYEDWLPIAAFLQRAEICQCAQGVCGHQLNVTRKKIQTQIFSIKNVWEEM